MSNTVQTPAPASFLNGIPRPKAALEGPAVAPGSRLVPARVARANESGVIVYIECPNWCTEDHVEEYVANVEDVMHRGDMARAEVASFLNDTTLIYALNARLEADPIARDTRLRGAHVTVWEDGGPETAELTADMAEELADDLVGLAARLRHLARTVRLVNHEVPAERAA